jgi:O-succinylbenzoic acid--CoA ligase
LGSERNNLRFRFDFEGESYVFPEDLELWARSFPSETEAYSFLNSWFDPTDSIEQRSSGSTGSPKQFAVSKLSMLKHARRSADFFKLDQRSRIAAPLPVSSIAWKMSAVRAQVSGGCWVWMPPSTRGFLERASKADFISIAPPQLQALLESGEELTTGVRLLVGGAPVSEEIVEAAQRLGPGVEVWQSYGMSESISHVALRRLHPDAENSYTAMEGIEFQTSTEGALLISDALTGLSLVTTDAVEWIDSRHFRWLGRLDAAINSGGIKIVPEPLEREWMSALGIDAMISSIGDPVLGRALCLVLEGDPNSDLTERVRKLNGALGREKRARWLAYAPVFPDRGAGKRDRKSLEDWLESRAGHLIPLR